MNLNQLDEETALSLIFANTKKKKRNIDLLTFAKTVDYLVRFYGSQKTVAEKVGLSTEMIREFLIPLKLPKEIQKLISDRRIDSIDTVREISVLNDPSKQIAAAKALIDSASKDVRDIKRLVNVTNVSIGDAKKAISDAKPKGLHIFVMDFDDEMYHSITKHAKVLKVKPAELVRNIVSNWLSKNKGLK
jgi:ParB-like chromosome segregation protein Spo0J